MAIRHTEKMTLDEKIALLSRLSLFRELSSDVVAELAKISSEWEASDGDFLFEEGSEGDCMYVIVHGRLRIVRRSAKAETVLNILQAPDYAGEMSLIDDQPRSADGICEGKGLFLRISRDDFHDRVMKHPQIALQISRALSLRLREDNERIQRQYLQLRKLGEQLSELRIARRIQLGLQPSVIPTVSGLEIDAVSNPAREVGGDFYDFVLFDYPARQQLGLIVGDVSGKGIAAAIIMAISKGIVRSEAYNHIQPGAVMNATNRWLIKDTDPSMFLALSYTVFDPSTLTMTYTSAGQPTPLIYHKRTQSVSYAPLNQTRIPIGCMSKIEYDQRTVSLEAGDVVFFCSDGIIEAKNPQGDLYGFERYECIIQEVGEYPTIDALAAVLADVARFVDGAEPSDDATLVAVRITGR